MRALEVWSWRQRLWDHWPLFQTRKSNNVALKTQGMIGRSLSFSRFHGQNGALSYPFSQRFLAWTTFYGGMQHANFAMGSLTLLSVRNVEYQRPGYERANNVREHKVRKIDQARIDVEHTIIQRISLTTVAWYVVHPEAWIRKSKCQRTQGTEDRSSTNWRVTYRYSSDFSYWSTALCRHLFFMYARCHQDYASTFGLRISLEQLLGLWSLTRAVLFHLFQRGTCSALSFALFLQFTYRLLQ